MSERREGYVNKNHIIQPMDLIEPDFQRDPDFVYVREVIGTDDLDYLSKLETQLAELRGAAIEAELALTVACDALDADNLTQQTRKRECEGRLRHLRQALTESETGDAITDTADS